MPEPIDHKAEALRLLALTEPMTCDSVEADSLRQEAFIHSNLAIAEGQERVAEKIAALEKALESCVSK